jgi:hypothetical protein
MTHERSTPADAADPMQSDHEEKVAEFEETSGELNAEVDPTAAPGRPTSDQDLAADRSQADDDVVGDDMSSPGQNSDRLPQ